MLKVTYGRTLNRWIHWYMGFYYLRNNTGIDRYDENEGKRLLSEYMRGQYANQNKKGS